MKHTLKKGIGLLIFLLGSLFVYKGMRYALVDDTTYYSRFTYHELYEQENIDVLFVGSSHAYVAIDPALMDRKLDLNTFNGGYSKQELDGSLTVIKEAAKYYNIKHVYLEMFYAMGGYTRKNRNEMGQTYFISDYLKPSISKYLYMFRASAPEQYIYSFLPMRREWNILYDLDKIQTIIKNKNSDIYLNPNLDPNTDTFYAGKGFAYKTKEITGWNYFQRQDYLHLDFWMSKDWKDDLFEIIQFCKENEIELTLFSTPMNEYLVSQCDSYDSYITMLRSLLEGTGVSYWDFNLCREEYFPSDSTLYYDTQHLNKKGADLFGSLFASFIQGEISPEELFYDSYDEKLQNLEPNVLGIAYTFVYRDDGTNYRNCYIISTPTEDIEYQVTIQPEEGELYQVQDYGTNSEFPLEDGAGKIIIHWRVKGNPEYTGERIIDFPAI